MNKKTKKAVRLLKAMKKRVTKKTLLASRKKDAFDILIATILSQRTRDENTRKAANSLLSKYPSAKKLANAPLKEIEKLIKPAGFYKEKAKRIKQVSKIIAEKYTGKVPKNLKALLELPGVGRKTANCVLVYAFKLPKIPADTHVHRLANLFELVHTKTPEQTEEELTKIFPKKHWLQVNETFVLFGQQVCKPRMTRKQCEKLLRLK